MCVEKDWPVALCFTLKLFFIPVFAGSLQDNRATKVTHLTRDDEYQPQHPTHTHISLGFGFYHYLSPCHGQPEKLSLSLPMTLSLSLQSSVLAISVPMHFYVFLNSSFITCFESTLTKTRTEEWSNNVFVFAD